MKIFNIIYKYKYQQGAESHHAVIQVVSKCGLGILDFPTHQFCIQRPNITLPYSTLEMGEMSWLMRSQYINITMSSKKNIHKYYYSGHLKSYLLHLQLKKQKKKNTTAK